MTSLESSNYLASVRQWEQSDHTSDPICPDCDRPASHPCHNLDWNRCGESATWGRLITVCQACLTSPTMLNSEVCRACAYVIQAYFADCNWHEAPSQLIDYVYGKNRVKS